MEIELLNRSQSPLPQLQPRTEYYVKEFEIELSDTNENTLIQYFCNSLNEPIFFPDRTLASLFNVNLSTLRGRFNRLTKQYEGYRILISEKSKTRIGLNHFINWTSLPTTPTVASNPNTNTQNQYFVDSNIRQTSNTTQKQYNSSPTSSPTLSSNNSLPLHGLVALNHIKLVNVALSEWIATNHERLGTKLSNIEQNFKKSEIPYQRVKDVISIVITKKEDLVPPFPITGNLLPYYFPRQTGIQSTSTAPNTPSNSSPNHISNGQLLLEENTPSSTISTPSLINSPQSNSPKSSLTSFKNLHLNQSIGSTNSKKINFNNINNSNNTLKSTSYNRMSPDLFACSDGDSNYSFPNSNENSRCSSPSQYFSDVFDNDKFYCTYQNSNTLLSNNNSNIPNINSNTRKRSISNDYDDQFYISSPFKNSTQDYHQQKIYKSNSHDEVVSSKLQKMVYKQTLQESPQSLKKYKSTNSIIFQQQNSPQPQDNIILNHKFNQSNINSPNNNNNSLNQLYHFQQFKLCRLVECAVDGDTDVRRLDISDVNCYDELKVKISKLFNINSFSVFYIKNSSLLSFKYGQNINNNNINNIINPSRSSLICSSSHEEWNEFIGNVRKIIIKPTITPEIKNLIH